MSRVQFTFYQYTGFTLNDEPESVSVIQSYPRYSDNRFYNQYTAEKLNVIKVEIPDEVIVSSDFLEAYDLDTLNVYYYYILGHQRINKQVVAVSLRMDYIATVGLNNIAFFGNIIRRSLTSQEALDYPRIPEPWAPKRPLKVRRLVIDVNENKQLRIPSHIDTSFEETSTVINEQGRIDVPSTPLGLTTTPSYLNLGSPQTVLPMIYPRIANATNHTIVTPWGNIAYSTPYESYYNLSGTSLSTFLEKAKKSNSMDLIGSPYYLPNPTRKYISLTEFNKPNIKNRKAYKFYTTITIRSLASNNTSTYGDDNANFVDNQELAVITVPDKNGGTYVLPTTLRDTGLNAYTYLSGVFSPYESFVMNAVGDTPGKFAADGTVAYNLALTNMFLQYAQKINTLQYSKMQMDYIKDLGSVKSIAMAFFAEVLGGISTSVTNTTGGTQTTNTTTNIPETVTNTTGLTENPESTSRTTTNTDNHHGGYTEETPRYETYSDTYTYNYPNQERAYDSRTEGYTESPQVVRRIPRVTLMNDSVSYSETKQMAMDILNESRTVNPSHQQTSQSTTNINASQTTSTTNSQGAQRPISQGVSIAEGGMNPVYETTGGWSQVRNYLSRGYLDELHSFMLGNLNDYLSRWAAIENDMHNAKVANLFKNVTLIGSYMDSNKLAGKYEILISSLQPEDEKNFDLFLQHFGHAVDEYTNVLVTDAGGNYNYVMVGEDAVLTNSVMAEASQAILTQLRTGVRFWKTQVRPANF